MSAIERLSALEILDSRSRPTLMTTCRLKSGVTASASVPSGASTGAAEAHELRDNNSDRYAGLGVLRAAENVCGEINAAAHGKVFPEQADLDSFLIDLDGTANKSRLGANAILSVSLAFCRAQALERGVPLYKHMAEIEGLRPRLPKPMINLFSGGKHAGGQVAVQDVQIVAAKAETIRETLQVAFDVFRAAANRLSTAHGLRLLTADEGGLAPPFSSSRDMFIEAMAAIEAAGYKPGDDVALTVDVAASHFYREGRYHIDGESLSSAQMVDLIQQWRREFPIVSVEDGCDQDDWRGWRDLARRLKPSAMILGDDLLCTNPRRIQRAISEDAADSLLLKVNQVGTLTEAAQARKAAVDGGWKVVVSARSGETEDDWLADLATGWTGDYIKVGSITQSERLAKYNRLLYLEHYEGLSL